MQLPGNSQLRRSLPGKFIVLDGPEGSGKTTQAQMLTERLLAVGLAVRQVRDPGSTRIGEQLRQILLSPEHAEMGMRCEMLLYMAARAQMMSQVIIPALTDGQVVVCDRFVSSTLAYQTGGEGLTAWEIRSVAQVALQGRWPDLTIILDLPAEQGLARVKEPRDRIEQRPLDYHRRVREGFMSQASADPARYAVVSADAPPQAVHEAVWHALAAFAERG